MTREEAIQWLTNEKWENANNKYKKEWNEAFGMAIEALQADVVSREVYDKRTQADEEIIDSYRQEFQKALSAEAVKVAYICDGRKCDKDCSECFRTLDIEHARDFKRMGDTYYQQGSADGEWIDSGEYPWSKCNKCGYTITCYQEEEFRYCPSCGAKMKGGTE